MIIWVLADNPNRAFYERIGGREAGRRSIRVGGAPVDEAAYVWPLAGGHARALEGEVRGEAQVAMEDAVRIVEAQGIGARVDGIVGRITASPGEYAVNDVAARVTELRDRATTLRGLSTDRFSAADRTAATSAATSVDAAADRLETAR